MAYHNSRSDHNNVIILLVVHIEHRAHGKQENYLDYKLYTEVCAGEQ